MVVDKSWVIQNKEEILREMRGGKIFIYPTDTIYGIGCNALMSDSVAKIRKLKQREIKPFSIIAPNMDWIHHHCHTEEGHKEAIGKLPGPYTLFIRLKNPDSLPDNINPTGNGTVGVRIPKHWFADMVTETGIPFITTSVNVSGMPYMTNIDELDETIKNNVDFIIYEGENRGTESIKIDLTK